MKSLLESDSKRYQPEGMPLFQVFFRKAQDTSSVLLKIFYKLFFIIARDKRHLELSIDTKIGAGLYFGHAFCITINPHTIIGRNCNIHKGVTIGQENRGKRMGTPIIGDSVWIGVNSTIVGKITIGNDVLIAPNSYVNCNIPDHSIVFGNPCIIKHNDNATEMYINQKV